MFFVQIIVLLLALLVSKGQPVVSPIFQLKEAFNWVNGSTCENCTEELIEQAHRASNRLKNAIRQEPLQGNQSLPAPSPGCKLPSPCEKPFSTDGLPDETQLALKILWAKSSDCFQKQNEASNFARSLPPKIRDRAFANSYKAIYRNKKLDDAGRRVAVDKLVRLFYNPAKYQAFIKHRAEQDTARLKFRAAKLKLFAAAQKALEEELQTLKETSALGTIVNAPRKLNDSTVSEEDGADLLIKELQGTQDDPAPERLQCGLPYFHHNLAANERKQLIAIWANYVRGEDCRKERKATQELLNKISVLRQALYFNIGEYMANFE